MVQPKILIVDDSEIIRKILSWALKQRGYDAVALDCVFDFNDVVRREAPDLALVDVDMPALRGDQLIQSVGRRCPCPLVLFSSRTEEELATLAKNCGAAGYIQKTEDGSALAERVQNIFNRLKGRPAAPKR